MRLARRRERRRIARKGNLGRRRSNLAAAIRERIAKLPAGAPLRNRIPLVIPTVFSLKDNFSETVGLISDIRKFALRDFQPVDLFFSEVVEIEPAALTVLTAEIFRCRKLRQSSRQPMVSGYYPKSPVIYKQLHQVGFFRLLDIVDEYHPDPESEDDVDRIVLPFVTDAIVTAERSAMFIDLLAELIEGAVALDDQSKRYLQGAIIEAMKNAGEHAYKVRPADPPLGHRWWLTGAFDRASREVSIVLFDQGVGIPATLEPDLLDFAQALASATLKPSDSLMIEVATRTSRTSTMQPGRGQGFRTMRKFVDHCDDGHLIVYSNCGHYVYTRAGNSRGDHAQSLGGTLIQWQFKHSAQVSVEAL